MMTGAEYEALFTAHPEVIYLSDSEEHRRYWAWSAYNVAAARLGATVCILARPLISRLNTLIAPKPEGSHHA